VIARLHTVAEDTLGELRTQVASWDHPPLEWAAETCMATDPDPDDLIFPRTTTRLGSKYQAVIPAKDNPRDPGWWRGATAVSFPGPTYEAPSDIQERGGEATVEVLSLVHDMSDSQGKHTEQSSCSGSHDPSFVR
jgi:hypothetical protein